MAPIVTSAEIARPANEVFAYATDPTSSMDNPGYYIIEYLKASCGETRQVFHEFCTVPTYRH